MSMLEQDKKIKVAVRARPLHPVRERYDSKCVRKVGESDVVVSGEKDGRAETNTYSFDYSFDEDDQQIDIYNEAVLELVDSTLDGHNACVLAYGQTGSGKTFTMLERCAGHMHVVITLSIIEIYIQEVRDLLAGRKPLKVQTVKDDVSMPDLRVCTVENLKDVFQYFKMADKQRVAKKTAMNDVSSRSHALFLIDLYQQAKTTSNPDPPPFEKIKQMAQNTEASPKATGAGSPKGKASEIPVQKSRIVLVDLAGSERIGRSLVEGKMKEEAIAINMSLTYGLYKGSKHVPYRDSALTLTLKSVFTDPNCKVLLCANMSPANTSFSETKSTLNFANKVKEIKAASVSVDPQAEMEYLERLKKLEELCGDLRIATVLHEFILQTPSRIKHVPLKDEEGRAKLLKQVCDGYEKELAKRKAIQEQREEDEIHKLAHDIANQQIKEMQDKQKSLNTAIDEMTVGIKRLGQAVIDMEAKKKDELEAKTAEAKKVRKQRRNAEDKIQKLEDENGEVEKVVAQLKEQLAMRGDEIESLKAGSDPKTDAAEEEEARRAEAHHASAQEVYEYLMHLRNHQLDYTRHRVEVLQLLQDQQKQQSLHKLEDGYSFCAEIAHWLVDRSVRVAEGKAELHDGENFDHLTRLLPPDAWPNPLVLVSEKAAATEEGDIPDAALETDYESDDVECVSVDVAYEAQMEQPSAPVQYDFLSSKKREEEQMAMLAEKAKLVKRQALQLARQRAAMSDVTKKYDEDQADKNYLMGIYDQEHLVEELLRYLYSGTTLMKHGRTGKPHKRKFFLPSGSGAQNELTWMESVPTPGDKGKRGVLMRDITGLVMGMYSKVFKRAGKVGPHTEGFYQSFTLVVKDGKRTIDVVAESVPEFEAWLLGLSNLLNKEPVWGEPLDLSSLRDPQEEELALTFSPAHRETVRKHHIRPSLLHKLRSIVSEKRDEVVQYRNLFNGDMQKVFQAMGGIHMPALNSKNALLMTKGELRFYTEIDIFRTCIIWCILAEEDLIYDPKFKLPTAAGNAPPGRGVR